MHSRIVFLGLIFMGALACGHPATGDETAAEGPVAAWGFDESQGWLSVDTSGQENHVLIRTGRLVKGIRKTALELDGRRGWASCARGSGLSASKAISLEAWIQPRLVAGAATSTIVRKDHCYALRFSGRRLGFLLWIDGTIQALTVKKDDWSADRWYHVAATYDGRQMRLFVDGEEAAPSPRPQTGRIDFSFNDCCVGGYAGGGRFRGLLDEVRVYDRALAPEEIRASRVSGLASAAAQKDVVIEPQEIGLPFPVLRKPPRKVTMVQPGLLWIDAEDFTHYGGWRLDTQFVHLVGSGYLIAAGTGRPVEDAWTTVEIPKAGKYRLWVRAKNWYKPHSPGKFRISVGDRKLEHVFGTADTEDWIWQAVGPLDLPQGPTRIALHDLTGYYGRCDALILTTDMDYTPPEKLEAIQKERSRLTGLSLEPELAGEFDVIVVGAGAAGSCAALASARMGAKTALIQDRPVLGGNASIELGVPINGAASMHRNAREGGIIEEAGRIRARYGFYKMSEPLRIVAEKEKNLRVFLNRRVIGATMADSKNIAEVTAVDTLDGRLTRYRAKMFIDSTGDGWLGYYAGAKYRHGREASDEFGEDLAPEKADGINMSGCLMGELGLSYRAEDTGKPVKYVPPPWAAKLPPAERFGRRPKHLGGQWWLEREGTINTLWDAEKSRDELIRISFGYWDFIKNHYAEKARAANHDLIFVPITEGKRESRRLVGDHILNQNDVQNATVFPDRIAHGGWPLDVHHAEGIYSGLEGPFHCNGRSPIYTIPFRSLYSVNVDNLLFAGRNMSVTHIALGTVRVQGTLAALGQAAGTGAALCLREQVTPRRLCTGRTALLQQTLVKYDQYIPEVQNEDPRDLARKARVTASSTGRYEEFGRESVEAESGHALAMSRAVMFPRGARSKLDSVILRLESSLSEPVEVTMHLREATAAGDFSSSTDVATATATMPPKKAAYVEFPVNCDLRKPFVWVWLPKTEGIAWSLMEKAPVGSCRAYGGGSRGEWAVIENKFHAFYTQPALAFETDFRPENVTNGVTRIIDRVSNLWVSDREKPLPQWIELDFDAPTRLTTVYLTFDTDMNAPFHTVPLVRQCVRNYQLSYHDGTRWKDLVSVAGNFQRRRVHRFEPIEASKLRLTVTATNGDPSARVFEIRAYDE